MIRRIPNPYDSMRQHVDDGLSGITYGFPNLLNPLSDEISKLGKVTRFGKNTYTVVGAEGGVGKSAFVMQEYVLKPFLYWKQTGKLRPMWLWFHTERSPEYLVAKMICWLMFVYDQTLLDVASFFGHDNKERNLTEKDLRLIDKYRTFVDEMFQHIELYAGTPNPDEIEKARSETFRASKDLDLQVINITDHINNIIGEKEAIDFHSDRSKAFRDSAGWAVVDVMQFNRKMEDSYRTKVSGELTIMKTDFYGSQKPQMHSDVMIGLLNPKKYQVITHYGYKMDEFYNNDGTSKFRFRTAFVVKNSFGAEDVVIPYSYIGECGFWQTLPRPEYLDYAEDIRNGLWFLNK